MGNSLLETKKREYDIQLNLIEVACEDGRRMGLAQFCIRWQPLILEILNLRVFSFTPLLLSYVIRRCEYCCMDGIPPSY
jgi:hypothetical protein